MKTLILVLSLSCSLCGYCQVPSLVDLITYKTKTAVVRSKAQKDLSQKDFEEINWVISDLKGKGFQFIHFDGEREAWICRYFDKNSTILVELVFTPFNSDCILIMQIEDLNIGFFYFDSLEKFTYKTKEKTEEYADKCNIYRYEVYHTFLFCEMEPGIFILGVK